MGKLVLYFSKFGNTESIAKRIAEKTGADICKIEPIEPYPENLQEVMEIGRNETDNEIMRPIKQLEVDLSKYDKVILGMPTWWYHVPPCVESFLKNAALEKITVFVTNSGIPLNVDDEMKRISPDTYVESSEIIEFTPFVEPSRLVTPLEEIDAWIETL